MSDDEPKVIVIDDDAILRRGLAIYLADSGYRALEAPNGRVGLDLCRDEMPDLVLCDLRMPGLDGLDVLSNLVSSYPELPVIILTGQGVLQDAIAALRRGAWDFLTKPILDYDMLEISLKRALGRSRLMKENKRYRERLEVEVERKAEAYRQSETRVKAIIESIHEAFVLVLDTSGNLSQALGTRELENRHGVTMEQVESGSFRAMFSPAALAWHDEAVRAVAKTGEPLSGLARGNFPAGKAWLECDYSPMRNAEDVVEGVLIFARDVTARRAAERESARLEGQMRQSQKMEALGTLAGGIAHDFNNMLAVILGFCDLALNDVNGAGTENALREINTAGRRAAELVRQILTFSRRSDVERGPLDLTPVVKEALRLLRSSLPTSIELVQDIARVGSILGNPGQIHQIILNLGSNAYHAMRGRESGRLSVRLSVAEPRELLRNAMPPGDYVHLRIADTGPGISQEIAEHIFEPFFTTKPSGEGTGMGLAIVHGVVTQYGGAIRLNSVPGEGAVFDIFLPRLPSDTPLQTVEKLKVPRGSGHILVVDDEPSCMLLGQCLLEDCGYTVAAYTSSLEALGQFRKAPNDFDLVVTDQVMPNLSGLSFARAIQSVRPGVPVLLVSGAADLPQHEDAYANTGVHEVLNKPLDTNALANAVWNVLHSAPALR